MIYENNKKYIGGAGAIDLEPFSNLVKSILENWKIWKFDDKLLNPTKATQSQIQNFVY